MRCRGGRRRGCPERLRGRLESAEQHRPAARHRVCNRPGRFPRSFQPPAELRVEDGRGRDHQMAVRRLHAPLAQRDRNVPRSSQASRRAMEAGGTEPAVTERVPYLATPASVSYAGLRLPVSILLDNVRSMYNVGAFFRTADGAGVERLLLSGITGRPPRNAIRKTALGADERVPWEGIEDPVSAVQELRSDGYEIAAIET